MKERGRENPSNRKKDKTLIQLPYYQRTIQLEDTDLWVLGKCSWVFINHQVHLPATKQDDLNQWSFFLSDIHLTCYTLTCPARIEA